LSTCSQNDFQDFFLKIFFFNSFSGAVSWKFIIHWMEMKLILGADLVYFSF
jgi:hypothetical protein